MSESKPLIETEDSKIKSFIKNMKPKKMKFYKRMKRNVPKFFGKSKKLKKKNIITSFGYQIDQLIFRSYNFLFIMTNNINKMRESKSLIETEDSKMESDTKNKKPKKMNIFKRMKRGVTKFFGKRNSYDELIDEEIEFD